jgi:hypothetical protein
MALHPKLLDTPTDSAQTSIHLASSIGQWRMVRWLIVAEELSRLAEVIHLESNRPTVVYDPSDYDKVITEVNSTAHKDTTFKMSPKRQFFIFRIADCVHHSERNITIGSVRLSNIALTVGI